MFSKRSVCGSLGVMVAAYALLNIGGPVNADDGDRLLSSRELETDKCPEPIEDLCPFIEDLEVTCIPDRSWLRATVVTDLPWGTWLTLTADNAFYRLAIVNWQGDATTIWRNPVFGSHEVCIDGCDICATVSCPCVDDADCNDGLFCNGDETCNTSTGECVEGEPPCLEGETCDEEENACIAETGFVWWRLETPLAVGAPLLVLHDGLIYALGGAETVGPGCYDNTYSDAILAYDLATIEPGHSATGPWTEMTARLPYAGHVSEQFALVGDTLYIAPYIGPSENCGWGTHNSMIEYSFATDVASEEASYPGYGTIWASGLSRSNEGTVYSFGGWNGGPVNKIFRYDQPGSLTLLTATLPSGLSRPQAICQDGEGNTVLFGDYSDLSRLMVFDPVSETLVYSEQVIPDDLAWAHIAWRDRSGRMFLADGYVNGSRNQAVYEYDPSSKTFVSADFSLPTPEPGAYLGTHGFDAQSGAMYIFEYLQTGSTFETWLWIGTPVSESDGQ